MSQVDTTHPVWHALKRQISARIAELQAQLEKPSDQDVTSNTRGRIAELRRLLDKTEPPPKEHQHQSPIY
jgi:hypothetical protein